MSPRRRAFERTLALAFAVALLGCDRAGPPSSSSQRSSASASARARPGATQGAALVFVREGREVLRLDRAALEAVAPAVELETDDPYYRRRKRFRAVPLEPLLERAFGGAQHPPPAAQQYLLRASDGYTVPVDGARLFEGGAHVALEDLDAPGWEPIGPQRANPAPFYLVWSGAAQRDLETHPRPWSLVRVELARFEEVFPHTAPEGSDEGSPPRLGYALFRRECARCHAINREGGRVGPELNVPQSIVEYRPEAQIRAYIRNPLTFRYGAMPAHPHLTEADLDALLAYLRAMSARKFDPEAALRAGDAGAAH